MKATVYNRLFGSLLIMGMAVLSACSPSTRITGSWIDPGSIGKPLSGESVFIASLSRNIELRTKLENALSMASASKNIPAIMSTSYFSPEFYQNSPSKEILLSGIRKTGARTVLTIALINKTSETRYVPGGGTYAPFTSYRYGGFYAYYSYWRNAFYDPGYYVTDKTYFMETNVYDVQSDRLIWSAQSESVNPGTIDNFVKIYPKILIERMISDGLLPGNDRK